jgi:transcriptional repressor NrdR
VLESRAADGGAAVRRRRECSRCGHRFTTYERSADAPLVVLKRDGQRQPFDHAKLRDGLVRAAHKRPVPASELDALVDRIAAEVERAGGELPAARIGEMCLEGLRRLDRISYLQFASVYKQLADVDEVQAELAELAAEGTAGSVRAAGEDSVLPPQAA